jgi:DNA-binding NtrC family response regulator
MNPMVMIVHDYEPTRQLLSDLVCSRGFQVKVSGSKEALYTLLMEEVIGLVIADADSFQSNAEPFVRIVRRIMPNLPIVMMVNDPDGGDDGVTLRLKAMDLPDRLDDILAMTTSPAA